jgi:DnaK suppressor protein
MAKSRKDSIKKLRELMIQRRDALRVALDGDLDQLQSFQPNSDVVDAALDAAQDELSSQLAEVESRELKHISIALGKIEDDTYGICEGCERKIPLARLQALPYALTCIECQREAEKAGFKSGGVIDWSRVVDSTTGDDFSFSDFDINV